MKEMLFYVSVLTILIPNLSRADSGFKLNDTAIQQLPNSSFFNGEAIELEVSTEYLSENLMAFPKYRTLIIDGKYFYAFSINDFTTVVSIYRLYKSFPKYYEGLIDYTIDLERREEYNVVDLVTTKGERQLARQERDTYKKQYTDEVKKSVSKERKTRIKTILWTVGGVVLGASLGVVSGIFIEKHW